MTGIPMKDVPKLMADSLRSHGWLTASEAAALRSEVASLRERAERAEERAHKADGLANEWNILTREVKAALAESASLRSALERLTNAAGDEADGDFCGDRLDTLRDAVESARAALSRRVPPGGAALLDVQRGGSLRAAGLARKLHHLPRLPRHRPLRGEAMSDCKHPLWERIRLCDEGACPDCLAARLAAAERELDAERAAGAALAGRLGEVQAKADCAERENVRWATYGGQIEREREALAAAERERDEWKGAARRETEKASAVARDFSSAREEYERRIQGLKEQVTDIEAERIQTRDRCFALVAERDAALDRVSDLIGDTYDLASDRDAALARAEAAERRAEEAEAEAAAKETTLRVVVSERTRAEARLRECEALIARHINDPAFGDNEIPFDAETMRELRLRALRSPGDPE